MKFIVILLVAFATPLVAQEIVCNGDGCQVVHPTLEFHDYQSIEPQHPTNAYISIECMEHCDPCQRAATEIPPAYKATGWQVKKWIVSRKAFLGTAPRITVWIRGQAHVQGGYTSLPNFHSWVRSLLK